jgi:hypothetical protein
VGFLVFSWYALNWAATLDYMARSVAKDNCSGAKRPCRQATVIAFPVMKARGQPAKVQSQSGKIVPFRS